LKGALLAIVDASAVEAIALSRRISGQKALTANFLLALYWKYFPRYLYRLARPSFP
jgi:hypothetical protein